MIGLTLREQSGGKRLNSTRELRELLTGRDSRFWQLLHECTSNASSFEEMILLSTLRRRAVTQGFSPPAPAKSKLRLAVVGGYTFYPLTEIIEHVLFANECEAEIWSGDYDNYAFEMMDASSELNAFNPEFVIVMPPTWRYKYSGKISDPNDLVEKQIEQHRRDILDLCDQMHQRTRAEIILCNFILPCYHDPGPLRTRTLASEWNSLKLLNMQLGLNAPGYIHICDLEFLAARHGGLRTRDDRAWFESKQPFGADFTCDFAREIAHLVSSAREASKKVLVVDLDNTLWGGTIGDDGINGIEIGDTSPRGHCFKEFQRAIRELCDRGVLLAVCSKNEVENAIKPFEDHPEMVLRKEDFVSFKANWDPKSENIKQIAQELNLSLDSFVFIDDNPAEIEIVRQFASSVTSLHVGEDPAAFIQILKDSRLFEPRQLTTEDLGRTQQYRQEEKRKELLSATTDMQSYLHSLEMVVAIEEFKAIDVPRISQLINKSNQFNLTTKRRTEAEVSALIGSESISIAVRLKDRFGDLGLVSVVIASPAGSVLMIDTWLMSCRVLNRQVEHAAMNELMERARKRGFEQVVGHYIPTAKNQMVKDFYANMGFGLIESESGVVEYQATPSTYEEFVTTICVERKS